MKSRRKGREFALQYLYAKEIRKIGDLGNGSGNFTEDAIIKALGITQDSIEYGRRLVSQVLYNSQEIDFLIQQHQFIQRKTPFPLIACSIKQMIF